MQNCLEFNNDYMDYYFQNSKHNIQKKIRAKWLISFFYSHRRAFIFVT